jgi:DNA-directed RNA polymerase specialized sigma24 family protein
MKNNENNVKRIYDKQTKTWFEVSPEQYEEFDRWRTNLRKREQYHHRCMCPRSKWWLCDGMCQDCEFHAPGDTLSLDMPVSNEDGDEVTLLDTLVDPPPTIESVICDKAELDQLFERLNELMPEAVQIGKLRQEGLSDAAIAEIIGIKRTTFLSRLKKAKEQLATEFPDRF